LRFAPGLQAPIFGFVKAGDQKSIVIVDDEMSFTDLIGQMLGDHFNRPILTFSNPLTALAALPGLNPGVLVTDYYMPHISGLDLIRQAGALGPDAPPCILITGHTFEDADNETARMDHFKAILAKPFRWQQLAVLIEHHWPPDAGPAVLEPRRAREE
jgi:two-component system, NtrC family, nitrogen regulation response regulator NtrX